MLQRSIVRSAAPVFRRSVPRAVVFAPVHVRAFASRNIFPGQDHGLPRKEPLPINYGIRIVPQGKAWVVERFGRFHRVLEPGLSILIPMVDRIAYVHSLKESAISIPNQNAVTNDNVTISMDGVLYLRIINPMKASYGVEDLYYSIMQLAQTTMRAEIGKITLDKTFAERESLNIKIVEAINKAAADWGVECLRYEIRDITPPDSVKWAMHNQAQAERNKRATILDSEGARQAAVNVAEGHKQKLILEATGEAESIKARANATALSIRQLADAIASEGGKEAVALRIAEQYVEAFSQLAKKSNTMLLPSQAGDPAAMVAQALSIYKNIVAQPSASSPEQLAKQTFDSIAENKNSDAPADNSELFSVSKALNNPDHESK